MAPETRGQSFDKESLHRHLVLLKSLEKEVQLPSNPSEQWESVSRRILHFLDGRELATALAEVQKEGATRYAYQEGMRRWLRTDSKFPGIWKQYGFGAIILKTEFEKPRKEERERLGVYTGRLVPGGFLLFDLSDYDHGRREALLSMCRVRLAPEILDATGRGQERDPLRKIYFDTIARETQYLLARKAGQPI